MSAADDRRALRDRLHPATVPFAAADEVGLHRGVAAGCANHRRIGGRP